MLGLIALLTFLLLARAFRSIVLAAKAVILNVVSLGASYGFLVLFWQQGHGSKLVYGVPATGSIRDFIPILVFAFLFGLSSGLRGVPARPDARGVRPRRLHSRGRRRGTRTHRAARAWCAAIIRNVRAATVGLSALTGGTVPATAVPSSATAMNVST